MKFFASSPLLAATAAATTALETRADPTCPATHVVYKYVYVDEDGKGTGDVAYRGPFPKEAKPDAPNAPAYPPSNALTIPPSDSWSNKPSQQQNSYSQQSGGYSFNGGSSNEYAGGPPVTFKPAVPGNVRSWSPKKVVPTKDEDTLYFSGGSYKSKQ